MPRSVDSGFIGAVSWPDSEPSAKTLRQRQPRESSTAEDSSITPALLETQRRHTHTSNGWQPDLTTGPVDLSNPNRFTSGHQLQVSQLHRPTSASHHQLFKLCPRHYLIRKITQPRSGYVRH